MPVYPNQKSLVKGGRVFSEAEVVRMESGTTGVILYAVINTATNCSTFRKADGTPFQVGGAATLKILAIEVAEISGTGGQYTSCAIGYANNDVGQNSGTGSLTSPIYLGQDAAFKYGKTYSLNSEPTSVYMDFVALANKYPFAQSGSGANGVTVIAYCLIN